MLTRRQLLARSSLVALAPTVPDFLTRAADAIEPDKDERILVVLQLDGGNDGINTVVPFEDEGYAKHRSRLRLPTDRLAKVNADVGLHPSLRELAGLLEADHLSVVQGVGYPNPNRSHFESMAIWQTAEFDPEKRDHTGWLGRAFDAHAKARRGVPSSVYVGTGKLPVAIRGRRCVATACNRPEDLVLRAEAKLDAKPSAGADDLLNFLQRSTVEADVSSKRMKGFVESLAGVSYPDSALAERMQLISRMIQTDFGARIYYARQPGYDTHSAQFGPHSRLLRELSQALGAFHDDLRQAKLLEQVVVLVFSEFGRTVKENGSAGTDHGTAGPVILLGSHFAAPLIGTTPSLVDLDPKHGDLRVGIDFRQVYATVLEDWLGVRSKLALAGRHAKLDLFGGEVTDR